MRPWALRPLHVLLCAPAAALLAASLTPVEHVSASDAPRPIVVAIDAGHGGSADNLHPEVLFDPGAIGVNGLLEKDVALDVARRVRVLLERDSVSVLMTRDSDVYIDITPRMQRAIDGGAQVFVSIHMDGNHDGAVAGTWVLYHHDTDIGFAQNMLGSLAAALRPFGVQPDGVLAKPEMWVHATMPTVTVEPLFLTNAREAQLAARSDVRDAIARAVHDAILQQDPAIRSRAAEIAAWRGDQAAGASSAGVGGNRPLQAATAAVLLGTGWWQRRRVYRLAAFGSRMVVVAVARLDGDEIPELLRHPDRRRRVERRRVLLARTRKRAHRTALYDRMRV